MHALPGATLFALTCLLMPGSATARDPALAGLERVVVVVVGTPPDEATRYGLTRESLRDALEDALGEWVVAAGQSPDVVRLRVHMNTTLYGFFSWSLRLQVERAVAVVGREGAYTLTPVWSAGEFGGTLLPPDVRQLEEVTRRLGQRLREALAY